MAALPFSKQTPLPIIHCHYFFIIISIIEIVMSFKENAPSKTFKKKIIFIFLIIDSTIIFPCHTQLSLEN